MKEKKMICPKCGAEMVEKAPFWDGFIGKGSHTTVIYQRPKCKNIEVIK